MKDEDLDWPEGSVVHRVETGVQFAGISMVKYPEPHILTASWTLDLEEKEPEHVPVEDPCDTDYLEDISQ